MAYYQAGYYLMKIGHTAPGIADGHKVMTASVCLNDSYYDYWGHSWMADAKDKPTIARAHGLGENQIDALQAWVDKKYGQNALGLPNVFYSLETLQAYRAEFFGARDDLVAIGLSFDEAEAAALVADLDGQTGQMAELGLCHALKRKAAEPPEGQCLGYDIIGVEIDGSFHSFHCHGLQAELAEKLGLAFNHYGLIEGCEDWRTVTAYCNDDANGLEPVPWFYAKVTLYP